MADSRGNFCWQQISSFEALTINMNRGKNTKAVHPDELNPYAVKEKRKGANKIVGKAAWAMFKQVVLNTMAANNRK